MTNTDKQQLQDEIYFLTKNKELKKGVRYYVKAAISIDGLDKLIDDQRRLYNYKLIEILKKYNVCPSKIHDVLDELWNDSVRAIESKSGILELVKLMGALLLGDAAYKYARQRKKIFNLYIMESLQFVRSLIS